MASLRTVRALEDDLSDNDVNVLLIDIHDDGVGQELAQHYRTNVTPTYIVLDAQGSEKWRGHTTPSEADVLRYVDD